MIPQVIKYLEDRQDADFEFNDIDGRYRPNREMRLLTAIDDKHPDVLDELIDYFEEKGEIEIANQLKNIP